MAVTVMECLGVKKIFGSKAVLKDVTLDVPKGSVFGLLGANGAGKTTLIKLIVGLLRKNGGTLTVLGEDPFGFSDGTKERFGYVPQRARLYPWLTVRQILDYTGSFYGNWNESLLQRLAGEWRIGLDEVVGNLSEGEAQKVMLMLALGHEPELLILDEPVASLDPLARRQFIKTILELVADRDCTVFFSTHITSDLERVAGQVAVLREGTVHYCGDLDTLKDSVKRLRVVGATPSVEDIGIGGVLHHETAGDQVILTVRHYQPQLAQRLKVQLNASVSVEDLNLEEIFLELNR